MTHMAPGKKKGAEAREKIRADALHPRPLPWTIPSEAPLPLPIPTAARRREALGAGRSRVCSVRASWQAAAAPNSSPLVSSLPRLHERRGSRKRSPSATDLEWLLWGKAALRPPGAVNTPPHLLGQQRLCGSIPPRAGRPPSVSPGAAIQRGSGEGQRQEDNDSVRTKGGLRCSGHSQLGPFPCPQTDRAWEARRFSSAKKLLPPEWHLMTLVPA